MDWETTSLTSCAIWLSLTTHVIWAYLKYMYLKVPWISLLLKFLLPPCQVWLSWMAMCTLSGAGMAPTGWTRWNDTTQNSTLGRSSLPWRSPSQVRLWWLYEACSMSQVHVQGLYCHRYRDKGMVNLTQLDTISILILSTALLKAAKAFKGNPICKYMCF